MELFLAIASIGLVTELGLQLPGVWWGRRVLALVAAIATILGSIGLLALHFNLFSAMIAYLSGYRAVNMLRIVRGRLHQTYLHRASLRTSIWLIAGQLAVIGAWAIWATCHETGHVVWAAVAAGQFAAAALSLISLVRTIRRTQWPSPAPHVPDNQLPTLTVAIPARNETDELQACLNGLIASDYPKLEIIVLDDCSQTRRTPDIIRGFAHDGVRFVQGGEPGPTWLPKNWAYNRLTQEASGEYILFCGVDIRVDRHSLRYLIYTMLHRQKEMLCVMPERTPRAYSTTSLLQAMRYWWELVPPRRLFKRPPVLSSCWVVRRRLLKQAGGFAAVARSIVPEAYFAKVAARLDDGYSFLRSLADLGIQSVKTPGQQRATAVRTRYPQVHRRPEQVALHTLLEGAFLLFPFALSVAGFWIDIGTVAHVLSFLACLVLVVIHELVVLSTRVNSWWFGLVAPPFMIFADVALLHYSMWKYEFSEVDWKGRNVCIPAMHVVSHLPTLPKKSQAG